VKIVKNGDFTPAASVSLSFHVFFFPTKGFLLKLLADRTTIMFAVRLMRGKKGQNVDASFLKPRLLPRRLKTAWELKEHVRYAALSARKSKADFCLPILSTEVQRAGVRPKPV